MELRESILTNNPCFKAGRKIKVAGLMLHSVGCPQPNAEVFVRNWNNAESARACVHAFIDGNTGVVYQTLPWDHRGWHCGGDGNGTHIGVEMCEPSCIKYTGGASFNCSDQAAAMTVVKRTYDAAVELFAFLCKEYNLNPLADGVIISHKEGHGRGIASGHSDPEHLWKGLGTEYTMDGFRQAVAAAIGGLASTDSSKASEVQASNIAQVLQSAQTEQTAQAVLQAQTNQSMETGQPGEPIIPQTTTCGVSSQGTPQNGEMTVSVNGIEMIARYEGCRLEAYKCPAGVWTIGYGHTEGVKEGDRLASQEEAKALLKKDVQKYADYVNACVKKGQISFPLNQNQFDALTSFCYNCGNGNLQKLVTGRDAPTVADKLLLYNKGGGKELPGLTRRRQEERALFVK